jgi:WD40 repeat-containing protein SMU1
MEIESQDVIRLILQFLKESNLSESMKTLQKESGVVLNTVDNVDKFVGDIRSGKWDLVLAESSNLKLSRDGMVVMYCLKNCCF